MKYGIFHSALAVDILFTGNFSVCINIGHDVCSPSQMFMQMVEKLMVSFG